MSKSNNNSLKITFTVFILGASSLLSPLTLANEDAGTFWPESYNPDIKCSINEYSLVRYLINKNEKCKNDFQILDLRSALKTLFSYWSSETNKKERYDLLSKDYQNELKSYGINDFSDYFIQGSQYERHPTGVKVLNIRAFSEISLEISVEVKWFQEGYMGYSTYTFELSNINNQWHITNIIN